MPVLSCVVRYLLMVTLPTDTAETSTKADPAAAPLRIPEQQCVACHAHHAGKKSQESQYLHFGVCY